MYSARGFFQRYGELLAEHGTGLLAYEALEREFIDVFGECRYSCYDSFRTVHKKYLEKQAELAAISAKMKK